MQKVLNQFKQNSVERWHMGHGRNHYILVVIRITLRYVTVRVMVMWGTDILCMGAYVLLPGIYYASAPNRRRY